MKKRLLLFAVLLCCTMLLAACGDKQENNPPVHPGPCEAHTFGEWQVTTASTCIDGEETRTCTVCGHKETKPISADKAHTYANKVCTVCGDRQPTEGLVYELESDGDFEACFVIGLGAAANETEIVIPQTHEGKPVLAVYPDVFYENTTVTYVKCPAYIAEYSFYGCTSLQTVVLYDIDTSAFSEELLEDMQGEGFFSIEASAFEGCTALTSVTIPASITSIEENAFKGCTSLIQTENGVSYVDKWVIGCNANITSVTLRADTVGIATGAFKNCTHLASVGTLPSTLCYINEEAFYGCSALATISIPASVKEIGEYAFYNCSALQSVTLPEGLKYIQGGTFSGCTGLTTLYIPASVTKISGGSSGGAFRNCTNLKSVDFANNSLCNEIDADSFEGCTALESIELPAALTDFRSSSNSGFSNLINLKTVTFQEGSCLKRIGSHMFKGCTGLTSINIPASITSIGDYAFEGCASLTSINIPNTVQYIGKNAFKGCIGLNAISLPTALKELGSSVFEGCTSLTSIGTLPDGVVAIGSNPFKGCEQLLENVDGVLYLNNWVISHISGITSATLRAGTTGIAACAFAGDEWGEFSTLQNISLPDTVSIIGASAFASSRLQSITIPTNVTRILGNTFYNCSALRSVTFAGNKVVTIEGEAFYSCYNLQSITLPQSLIEIGARAFQSSGLQSISIPASVTYIASFAFSNCDYLNTVSFAEGGQGLRIKSDAFSYCPSLTTVTLPTSFIYIDTDAFSSNIYTLENGVYYLGNWVVGYDNNHTLGAITLREGTVGIASYAFSNCNSLTAITIPATVKYIDGCAFSGCQSLQAVTFAQNSELKYIGNYAFNDCTALTAISIPASVTEMGNNPFLNTNLLVTENGVTYVDNWAIRGDDDYEVLVLRDGTAGIAAGAFDWCSSLLSISLPSSLKSIGSYAFRYCRSLESIVIPNSVVHIGYDAFYDCSALTSVTLPASLTALESGVFQNCSSLESIVIPAAVTTIRGNAFSLCDKLTSITFASPSDWEYTFVGEAVELHSDLINLFGGGGSFIDNTIKHANISATDLANSATAATYLTSTYTGRLYCWCRVN